MVDPTALPRYTVIYVYYEFKGERAEQKYFVVLGHKNGFVICLKATSQTQKYDSDEKQKAGCVYYKANEISFFHLNTAIQPENCVPIPCDHIIREEQHKRYENMGMLPGDFHEKLVAAIRSSITISPKRKKSLLEEMLGEHVK